MKQKWMLWVSLLSMTALTCFWPSQTKDGRMPHHNLCGDSLRTLIAMPSEWYRLSSYPIGFNYALLLEFNEEQHTSLDIRPSSEEKSPWEALVNEEIDLLIINTEQDSLPRAYKDQVRSCYPIRKYEWYVRANDQKRFDAINFWLGSFRHSDSFQKMEEQFFRSYNIDRHLRDTTHTQRLSPYDHLIRHHAKTIGWDWRLLAALIYKESRFSIWVESSFGAVGLMQVKPSTAAHYDVYNVYDPNLNIQAGTAHLRYLQRLYEREGMDSTNIVKFTLAAYNAGEGRMDDCMNFALSQGKDYRKWSEVAKIIPLMSEEEHYNGDVIKLGKFRGTQTLDYVESVLKIYEDYCLVMPN
ncbi:MAG: transglycosylase SLT domain-containing protein [Bacteroidales bacterium]|nr:transglycosylase SLT domain-containing protein [Bacteroidales bacterium]